MAILSLGLRSTTQLVPVRRMVTMKSMNGFELRDAASTQSIQFTEAQQKWYACGPTVYDAAHLGHARTYVTLDVLRRVASRWGGVEAEFAMGVTDIDDKIIQRAKELNIDSQELAREEENKFFADMKALGCLPPDRLLRVSEHVDEIIRYIEDIIKADYGYETADGVWFDVARLGDLYGTFAEARGTSQAAAAAAAAAETNEDSRSNKRDVRDFALWKLAKSEEEPGWDSPWGRGRPGWHIECSAMTRAAYGNHLDLHAGGVDLAFPHHENEVAQWRGSLGGSANTWCDCWVHTGHLHIEGRKMSKSLKNFITVKDLLNRPDFEPEDFRMLCCIHRYRSTLSFADDALIAARKVRLDLETTLLAARDALRPKAPTAISPPPHLDDSATVAKSPLRMAPKKRFGLTENDLAEATIEARTTVNIALLNDLDAPTAMNALSKLATRVRQYALSEHIVAEPLFAASSFIADTLRDLGYTSTTRAWFSMPTDPSIETKQDDDSSSLAELTALVDFRAEIRAAALAGDDALKQKILQLCDDLREAPILKERRLAIVDRSDGTSSLARALEDEKSSTKEAKPRKSANKPQDLLEIPPSELFKVTAEYKGKFSQFDDDGLPSHDADGNVLSKSMRKKLKKRLDIHTTKWSNRQLV